MGEVVRKWFARWANQWELSQQKENPSGLVRSGETGRLHLSLSYPSGHLFKVLQRVNSKWSSADLASGDTPYSSFLLQRVVPPLWVKRNPPPHFFFHCLPTLPKQAIESVFCALLLVGCRWKHPKGAGWDPAREECWPHVVAGAAREYRHLHCASSLPQGRSEPVFEEVPIVQMTKVISCLDVFEY